MLVSNKLPSSILDATDHLLIIIRIEKNIKLIILVFEINVILLWKLKTLFI